VSVVTVSRALRDQPDIAKDTKARILDRIRELNYRPNLMARSLVTGRSSLIGLVVPDLIHPFFAEIAKGLAATLRKRNYFLVVSSSDSDPRLEQDEIEHMLAHHLDCFVVASCQKDPESLRRIVDAGVPLILIDRGFQAFDSNYVGVNDRRMGELATEHLIEQGAKRIAHIRGPLTRTGNDRADGYRDTLRKHGRPAPDEYVVSSGESSDSNAETRGKKAMERILALKPRPDGLFCFNDTLAAVAMMGFMDAGLRIPKDMAIVGCGNFHYSAKLRVPLSSVDQKSIEIGERTAKMIAEVLEEQKDGPKARRPRTVILEPKLVIRASSQLKKR